MMFDLGRHLAPLDVVVVQVMMAVKNFFAHDRLLREANTTIIAPIPKKATTLSNFRPISCYNTIYKCIARILVMHIMELASCLIGSEQSAFIPGRRIVDNILVAHEIVLGYHSKKGKVRCAMKIDIQKAYDSIEWGTSYVWLCSVLAFSRNLLRGS